MRRPLHLDPRRYFPADPQARSIAARLFGAVEALPIISPHGHTDPRWFSANEPFEDAVSLLLWPDHYLLRMLMSPGVPLESLGVRPADAAPVGVGIVHLGLGAFHRAHQVQSALDDPALFPLPIRENASLRAALLEVVA